MTGDMLKYFIALKEKHPQTVFLFEGSENHKAFKDDAEVVAKTISTDLLRDDENDFFAIIGKQSVETCIRSLCEKGYQVGVVEVEK